MGAPLWLSSKAQASTGIKNLNETLDALKEYQFEKAEGDYILMKEPIGVIGMITPWNWPMNQITTKVSAALAAGCTMVLKPSEISPYCAMLLAEVFDTAGVPAGIFNVVNGYGPTVGAALSEHKDVDMMSFTGSTRAGIAVAQASATTVKRVHQELGGKSSNIILDDVADLERSVKGGAGHCFLNSGQSCNAPTKMLVSAESYEKAVEVAAATAESTTVGDPHGEFRMGPIANKAQYEKVLRMIEIGIEEGATLVAGGVERLNIQSNGNLGIGTIAPTARLHINDTNNANMLLSRGDAAALQFRVDGIKDAWISNKNNFVGNGTSTNRYLQILGEQGLYFRTGNANTTTGNVRMSILNNGNIGFGTTFPAEKMHLKDGNLALEWSEKAVAKEMNPKQKAALQEEVDKYKEKKPWRERKSLDDLEKEKADSGSGSASDSDKAEKKDKKEKKKDDEDKKSQAKDKKSDGDKK